MKQKLLLICIALLCSAVSWAYTGVVPQVGRSYYLYNIGTGQYWKGTSTSYSVDVLANATPITVESGYKFAFVDGSTTYRIYQDAGTAKPNNQSGVNFTLQGDANGYRLESKNTTGWGDDYTRDMQAGGSFPRVTNHENNVTWQFIACEEAMTYMSTFCAGVAEANYVQSAKGWERVTTISQLQTNPENYFFAIFSANAVGLIVDASSDNAEPSRPYYKTATGPLSSSQYLFEIENYEPDGFALKSCGLNNYFGNNSDSWNFQNPSEKEANCKLTITLNDGAYRIQSANADWGGRRYWGLYDYTGYTNGQKFAGNKNDAEKGSFLIYRIAKKNLDLTSAIVNPSFETNNTDGWDYETSDDHGAKENSNSTYTMSNVDGSYLFNIWRTGNTISQTLPNMPAGIYKLTAVMGTDADQTFRLMMGSSTGTAASVNKGTGVTVEAYYKLAAHGNLTISADAGGSNWYKVDNFHLYYMEPSLPESLEELTGLMNITKKNTANTAISNYNTAIATYNSDQTSANLAAALAAYDAAQNAITAAEASKEVYVTISDIMTTYQDKADALDAAGQAAYTSAINTATTGAASKYNDGTYTTAAEAETAFTADYRTAVKAQVTAGSDMTDAIINPSFETGNISPWTSADGGGVASNNNWSSGKVGTYFVERWQTSASGGLSDGTLTQTLTGMPAGRYTLTANAQNIEQYNSSEHGTGYYLTLGSEQTEVTSGILTTVTYDLAAAGNLTIGMKLDDCTGNWVSCDNFRLTYVGVEKNVTVAAKARKYGTVILPFTYNFAGDGDFANIKFYSCASVNNGYTQIVEVRTPEANTPYIIKNNGEEDFSKTISGFNVAEENSYTVGLLTGVYTNAYIPVSDGSNSYYVLQTKDDVQAFYKVEDADFSGTPYKCYMTLPAATPVKAFMFPENPTAINAIETAENENTEIYNLAGQRLSKAQKGVNIVNGKKVLVK